jgi:hypothetical protein
MPSVTGSETATERAPRGRRVSRAALAVGALVVASTVVRFAVAQAFTTPWIAPDEMVYGMLGEGLWSHGTLTLRTLPSPYFSLLTPALIGAPLAALDLGDGVQWARLLQGLAMSLVAVPTYLWARRLASPRWAIGASALVLAAPALHYSGFLMTEPLTLTTVTVALLMLARALEEPSMWRYGVFVAWATVAAAVRLQALVLLPAFLLAAALDSIAARDRARLRPLLWFSALAAAAAAIVVAGLVALGEELSTRRLLGAYTPVGEATGVSADRFAELAWHAFDVSLLGLGVTVLALAALVWVVFSRRERDPGLRAFVATTLAYATLLVVQVALFAATFVGTVAERYLITLLPLLAIGLCAWGARGAPRALGLVLPVWALIVVGAALVPIDQLATPETLPNAPTAAALTGLASAGWARTALVVAALAAGVLVLALPRRLAWIAAATVGVGLALLSVASARQIDTASAHEERAAIGSGARSWLDDAGVRDATLLVTGDQLWTATARTIFWNRGIAEAAVLDPATTPFPPVVTRLGIDSHGVLRTASGPLQRPIVVAPATVMLAGDKIAGFFVGDSESYGYTAWQPEEPVRVILRTNGFLPNGDFSGTARVTVYACRQGTLDVTILGKSDDPVEAVVDGIDVARLETPNGGAVTHHIPAPPDADGTRACVFELQTAGYAGTTTIVFTPSS